MTSRSHTQTACFPVQVTITADPDGASVMIDCQVAHRAEVAPGEEAIVDGRASDGQTHPAVERAICWARDHGYDVAVVIW